MIKNELYKGERPLYRKNNIELFNCKFTDGESAIKEGTNITSVNNNYDSKYPLWHCKHIILQNDCFNEGARAAVWYSHHVTVEDSKINAPKIFRDGSHISIKDTMITSEDCLWDCSDVKVRNTEFEGEYFLLHSNNIELTRVQLTGNYAFQHVDNMIIKDSTINAKDAFWNSRNVTVYNSVINGEYLGWYSENLKLINCRIKGTQPLCYAKGLVLENCEMIETDLSFELSEVNAVVTSEIKSVKNPLSGKIKAAGIGEIIMEETETDKTKTEIIIDKSIKASNIA